jgi:uncharacterized protein YjbJ (UPF0337 family)
VRRRNRARRPDQRCWDLLAEDPETAVQHIVELVKTRIPKRFGLNPIRDIQVLCPMNRGGVGARSLNIELQAALNPAGERKVERFGWTFAPGDKVMQIENDYDKEVYNGGIGYIDDVDPEVGELRASFDGRSVTYGFGELDTLVPAYAATIHKSQASEYPAVIIPVMTQHYPMLQRNLLYTGLTRGKRLVVLVGQKMAIAIAVRNVSGRRRWSKLDEWLARRVPHVIRCVEGGPRPALDQTVNTRPVRGKSDGHGRAGDRRVVHGLSRFRSCLAARQRDRFAVIALKPANNRLAVRPQNRGLEIMDKDRIKGSVEQAKGAVKEAVGKAAGDAKLEVEGRNEKAAGKVQNAVGGVKDALRDALKK